MSGIVGNNTGRGSGTVAAASVTGAEIADDSIDSEHYVDGSIDNAHIADDAIDSEHYAAASIDEPHLADNSVDSRAYVDGSIDPEHLADNAVTLAKMASGTDGNIISYDASGNPVAIATGSSGQVLTSAGAGAPPTFSTLSAGGGILQVICKQDSTRGSDSTNVGAGDTSYTSAAIWSAMTTAITPSATSSYIYFTGTFGICGRSGYCAQCYLTYQVSGGTETPIQGDLGNRPVTQRIENAGTETTSIFAPITVSGMFAPSTTSEITIRVRTGLSDASHGGIYFHQTTATSTSEDDGATPMSTFTVFEIAGSISPSLTNTNINS